MPLTRITHENISNNTIQITDLSANAVNSLMFTANTILAASSFSANLSVDQSGLTTSVYTKVNFDTEQFDTGNAFNTTTGRFTPTVPGYYLFNFTLGGGTTTTITRLIGFIYKNGSGYQLVIDVPPGGTLLGSGSGSVIVYMNGSTDYIEAYGAVTGTGTLRFESDYTRLTGVLVQAT